MVDPIFDYQFRLILIGDSVVGKSSLLKFFTDGKFAEVRVNLIDWGQFGRHHQGPLIFLCKSKQTMKVAAVEVVAAYHRTLAAKCE